MEIVNEPSPSINPLTQWGFRGALGTVKIGLAIVITLGKAAFNATDKPKLSTDFKESILCNPSSVKCSLFLINIAHFFHN
jgi:hypothetical protein